ncbi:hypothetical protein LUZ61_002135 [Rhynchospora tenuis]|uniref:PGG domain-containing protein n=1 Tax=Rhynchospora tenuis TaxID=198213 RepID=A0AAD5ZIF5_9POAL|nr:hypothetical protein LUZ61_002135 [Rhynchospora tenuis]
MLPELRPAMDADLFKAAIKGNSNVLIQRLGLPLEAQTEIQVTIETSDIDTQKLKAEHKTNQSDLRSATDFGDTLLHLLITERHNELALKVFSKDMSLLKAHNNKLETPLHCAAKFGNEDIIHALTQLACGVIRDALGKTNENGDTALHVAANHDHSGVVSQLMMLDPQAAYKKNKQGFSPLYIATVKGYTDLVQDMLKADINLACTQFSDGSFPIHLAAHMGNTELVEHFLQEYPDDSTLLDPCRRNLFHMAAEEEAADVFTRVFALTENDSPHISQMVESMINALDYEGNTPLHIAAMKGHKSVMREIWDKLNQKREALLRNQNGETAFGVSYNQLWDSNKDIRCRINDYIENEGWYFTPKWFDDVMEQEPLSDKLEKVQVIGLGSVLITTVAFAAAFTVPGGYHADNETTFMSAANCMVVAFGLGSYVMLAPLSLPIAIIILVVAMLVSSPTQLLLARAIEHLVRWISSRGSIWENIAVILAAYGFPFLFIFCLAFLGGFTTGAGGARAPPNVVESMELHLSPSKFFLPLEHSKLFARRTIIIIKGINSRVKCTEPNTEVAGSTKSQIVYSRK